MKLPVYSIEGKKVSEREVSDAVFGVSVKDALVYQVVVAEQANSRQVLAHTLTRSEVRGGGKKPWKQKGTGRARHGSIRSPLWRGGGITFGPRSDRNFTQTIPIKMRRKAILMGLANKAQNEKLVIVENLSFTGKTKDYVSVTANLFDKILKSDRQPSVLVLMPTLSDEVKRATKNLTKVDAVRVDSLSLRPLLQYDVILTNLEGVEALEKRFAEKVKSE
jgi:large subunit ribosomal protein L4